MSAPAADALEEPAQDVVDLERLARDQIAKLIIRQFKGRGMALLVDAIQAVVLPYDGLNPLPPQYCYLKPHYLDVQTSYFEHAARGTL